jgi:hypothetical protein
VSNPRDLLRIMVNNQIARGEQIVYSPHGELEVLLDMVERTAVHRACEQIRAMNGECGRCEACTTRRLVADELDPFEKIGEGRLADKMTGVSVTI